MRHVLTTTMLLALVTACPADDGEGDAVPQCIEYALDGCAPLYPATYDHVWNQTLADGCAQFGSACHASADAAGAEQGMVFDDPQQAWDHMTNSGLVVAGDPLCSPFFVRLASDDPDIRMPPGSSGLSDGALCSIGSWIAEGAAYTPP
jgi:hypothetical protein